MKLRSVAAAVGASLLLPSATLHALGMGDIDVHSGLNQPLDATIRLISVDEGELDGLAVTLAPKAAFERMGLDRMKILSNLEFEVVSDSGAPYVKVSSTVPVREPFLDFILSVNWANGQMLREYTLLLDPPVFDQGETASPIEEAITSPATIAREAMDEFEQTARHEVSFEAPSSGSYGPTKTTDTLWAIAKNMRPDSSITVPQMMLALLKENPDAFINNNVNNLKAGYVLRAPQMSTIAALSKVQAAAETNRQYQAWLKDRGRPVGQQRQLAADAAPAAGQLARDAAPQGTASGTSASGAQARLQLVSPEDAASPEEAGGSDEGRVATLQQQLSVALEAAEASRQENAELRSRLNELERQLANVQRLITLQDDTMSALQSGLAEKQSADAPVSAFAVNEIEEPSPVAGVGEAVVVEAGAIAETEKTVTTPVAEKSTPPAVRTPLPQASLVDDLLENPTMLAAAGGGVVLVLLLIGLMMRRRRQSAEDDIFDTALPASGSAAAAGTAAAGIATPVTADSGGQQPLVSEDYTKNDDGLGDAVGDLDEYGGFGDDLGTIHAEESEIDPIAEADVYLAYRRYEQAESLLKEAIQQDDERPELKLKLMEIYYTTKDQEAFEAQAEAFYAASGGEEEGLWNQAVEMGRELCPDHPLFSEAGGVLSDSVDDDSTVLDLGDTGGSSSNHNDELNFESLSEPEPEPFAAEKHELDDDLPSQSNENEFDLALSEPELPEAAGDTGSPGLDLELDESLLSDDLKSGESGLDTSQTDSSFSHELDLDQQPMSAEAELDFKLDLESDSFTADAGATSKDVDLEVAASGVATPDESLFEAEKRDDFINDFSELDLDLPVDTDEADNARRNGVVLDTDGGVDDLSLPSSDFDLDLGGEKGASVVADDSFDDALSGLNEEESPNKEGSGRDDFELDALDDIGNLDNVINFESPDAALNESGLPESEMVNLDGELEELAASLDDDVLLSDEKTTAPGSETATESANWEIEPAISSFGEMDEEYSLFESTDDVVGTKLDLAKAYIDMGDQDGARSILDEVVKEGSDTQREEAEQLMQQMG